MAVLLTACKTHTFTDLHENYKSFSLSRYTKVSLNLRLIQCLNYIAKLLKIASLTQGTVILRILITLSTTFKKKFYLVTHFSLKSITPERILLKAPPQATAFFALGQSTAYLEKYIL